MNYHQMSPGNIPSTSSTFCSSGRPSVNFLKLLCRRETFCQTPSIFCPTKTTSVNFPCGRENFRQVLAGRIFVSLRQISVKLDDIPSTSVYFPCCWETFRKLPSTFRTSRSPSANSINFLYSRGTSITFVNFPCGRETFRQLPSNFCAARRLSMNFLQFSVMPADFPKNFHKIFVWSRDRP